MTGATFAGEHFWVDETARVGLAVVFGQFFIARLFEHVENGGWFDFFLINPADGGWRSVPP